jgi:hypothetical protein
VREIDDPKFASERMLEITSRRYHDVTPLAALQPWRLPAPLKPSGEITKFDSENRKITPDTELSLMERGVTKGRGWTKLQVELVLRPHEDYTAPSHPGTRWIVTADEMTGLIQECRYYEKDSLVAETVVEEFGEWHGVPFPKRMTFRQFHEIFGREFVRSSIVVLDLIPNKQFTPEDLTIDRTKIIDKTAKGRPRETIAISPLETELRRAAEQVAKLKRKVEP